MAIASKMVERELYIILENLVHIILFTNQYVYFSIVLTRILKLCAQNWI